MRIVTPLIMSLLLMTGAAAGAAARDSGKTIAYGVPTAAFPYHHASVTIPAGQLSGQSVDVVEVDGAPNRDARFFACGKHAGGRADKSECVSGEFFEGGVAPGKDLRVVAPVNWSNGSSHTVVVKLKTEAGAATAHEFSGTAPVLGGYWSADWPYFTSIVLEETAGLARSAEPIHVNIGVFADEIKKPEAEIRVITFDPKNPKAGKDGYVETMSQIESVSVWRDERLLETEEKDAKTGEVLHRYDATTSLELVFLADVLPHENKVYQIVYGNRKAEVPNYATDLKVSKGEGMSETVDNAFYSFFLSKNSGSVETVKVLGDGEPVVLEHKLETNGAVHWNPDIYSPPTPWVHASDWEKPVYERIAGPLMLRTRRVAPMPHMDSVDVSVSYEFYAGQPYVLMSSFMEVKKDLFVQAMRNAEIVFNHEVLDEFVWPDEKGAMQSIIVEQARKHPKHGLEIPVDTPWMALINRQKGIGFAAVTVEYQNGNRYAQRPSLTQPYFYVQNGPWVYVSRPLVYPFGGSNFTRMMPVRAGSFYVEKTAWVPFRFAKGDDPFTHVKQIQQVLTHPLGVREWMATNKRTPEKWVTPILTMPFDEGVADAASGTGHAERK